MLRERVADPLPASAPPESDIFILGDRPAADTSVDFYKIVVPEGKSVRAEIIEGDTVEVCEGDGIDSHLVLLSSAMDVLAVDLDGGRGLCSMIDGTGTAPRDPGASNLPAGIYYLRVDSKAMNASGQFKYRLAVTIR